MPLVRCRRDLLVGQMCGRPSRSRRKLYSLGPSDDGYCGKEVQRVSQASQRSSVSQSRVWTK